MSRIDELDPSYLRGIVRDEPDKPPDLGFWGQAKDVGIKVLDPVLGAARTVSTVAREAEDDPHGMAHDVDRWIGRQQTAIQEEGLSPQQKAIDDSKWFNVGPDDRSAWDHPFKKLGSEALGLVAPLVATGVTGGGAAAGLAVGALNSGTALAHMHDKIDQASKDELLKLKPYADAYRNNGGDDLDAREQLIKLSTNWVSVATNAGANMLSFGALGHAMGRAATDSGLLNFLGRAAFGGTEGAVLGASQGVTGELVQQKANVAQGKQSDVDFAALVRAGEESVPGMAVPLSGMHGFRRGPHEAETKGVPHDQPQPPPPGDPHWTRADTDVTSALAKDINPPTAIDTGVQFGPHLPDEQHGPPAPPNLSGPSGTGPQPGGVWGQAQPGLWGNVPREPPPPPPGPPERPQPVSGIWTGARPEVQARMSPEYGPHEPYGPPAPPPPPPPPPARPAPPRGPSAGGGVWAGSRTGYLPGQSTEQVGPPHPDAPQYGPPAPPPPPAPLQQPPSVWAGARPNLQSNVVLPPPSAAPSAPTTVHLSPEDAKKIRPGFRLAPGMREGTFELVTKGNKHVGRVRSVDRNPGTVPVSFGDDGVVTNKGKAGSAAEFPPYGPTAPPAGVSKLPADTRTPEQAARLKATKERIAQAPVQPGDRVHPDDGGHFTVSDVLPRKDGGFDYVVQHDNGKAGSVSHEAMQGFLGGYPYVNSAGERKTSAPARVERATPAGPSAAELHAEPLQPGRGTWHSNVGQHEVEILPNEGERPGHQKIRYEITDKAGRRHGGEAWVRDEELTQGYTGPAGPGGGPGGEPPGGGGGGKPQHGTLREQMQDLAAQIAKPSNEPITPQQERTIRGGLAPAKPLARQLWAVMMEKEFAARGFLHERNLPDVMRRTMDDVEWRALVDAAAQNPRETIEIVRKGPAFSTHPTLREINYRLEDRKARAGEVAGTRTDHPVARRYGEPQEEGRQQPEAHVRRAELEDEAVNFELRLEEYEKKPTPDGWLKLRRIAELVDENRQGLGMPAQYVEYRMPERPTTAAERTRATPQAEPVRQGPLGERATYREQQLVQAITELNAKIDRAGMLKPSERVGLVAERQRLLREARLTDAGREMTDRSTPFEASIRELPPYETKEIRFNREVEKLDAMRDRPAEEMAADPAVREIMQRLDDINRQRTAAKQKLLPLPTKLQLVNREIGKARRLTELEREAERDAHNEYLEAKRWADRQPKPEPPAKVLTDVTERTGEGYRWTQVFKNYWDKLSPSKRTKLKDEARAGLGKTLSPAELREAVIKEVEELWQAARDRAAKGLAPRKIRTQKIEGMRQDKLPEHIPSEAEALERLRVTKRRMDVKASGQKTRQQQYDDREQSIMESIKGSIKKSLGSEKRFADMLRNIMNVGNVLHPDDLGSDITIRTMINRKTLVPVKLPENMRKKGAAVNLLARRVEAPRRGETVDVEADDATAMHDKLYAKTDADYVKVKQTQLAEAQKLQKFLEVAIDSIDKGLKETAAAKGYSGGSIKFRLPQERRRGSNKGVEGQLTEDETGRQPAKLTASREIEGEARYSGGSADEAFGAYSLTADLMNLREQVRGAVRRIKAGLDVPVPIIGTKGGQVRANRLSNEVAIARNMKELDKPLIDFSWTMKNALAGDWKAIEDFRRARTATLTADFKGLKPKATADEPVEPGEVPRRDASKGKHEDVIEDALIAGADARARLDMFREWKAQKQKGNIGDMPFLQFEREMKAERAEAGKRAFAARQQAVKPVERVEGGAAGMFRRGIAPADGEPRALADNEYRKYGRPADIDELIMPAMGNNKGDYFIDPRGRLYEAHTNHPETFAAMDRDAGYDVDNEKSLYTTGDNPLVRVSTFTWHPDDEDGPTGYNHTVNVEAYKGGVTRAQKRTIDRIRREAESAKRDGEDIRYFDEVTTGYGGNYYVNMDAVHIKDEPYRGMPLDDDAARSVGPTHDAKGLPVEREQTPAVRDAHEDLSLPGTPRDQLISAPETTTAALDRVKGMIRDGTAGELPAKYINDEFLDQLARITQGTEVYHAPYAVVAGPKAARGGSWAEYLPFHDRVILSNDVTPDHYARSVLHETVHAATEGRLNSDPVFAKDVNDLVAEATAHAERQGLKVGSGDLYGLTNPHEYLTESVSNSKFRDFLESIDTDKPGIKGPSNLLQATYRAIRNTFSRVMGFFHGNTALDVLYHDQSTVLGRTDALIKRTMADIERQGREHRMPTLPDEQARHADGRYFARGIGANEFIKNAYGETQAWGKDVADRAKYAWDTKSKVRARGLDFMTPYDQTKISHRPEFRGRMEKAFDTIEKVFAEGNKLRDQDKRELAAAAKHFYSWSKGNRQRAAEAMIDESNHGYFADRELNQKGNEHFSDTLENAQAKEEHATHQAEYKYLAQHLPHYDEFRTAIHQFAERREEQLRKERIRDLVRYGSLLPEDLDNATRERVSEAVRYWIDTKPERLPDTGKGKAAERFENMRETLERVPDKALIKQHLDVDNPDVLARIKEIRATPQMAHIPGPYVPFTRQGKFAVSGNIDIPKPANAILLEGDINHATGVPAGNDRYVFKTEAEARAFERDITRKLGIKQLKEGSGPIDIDVGTGRRAEVPEKMEEGDDPQRFQLARGKALQALKDAGANIEQHYAVQFQRKVLYYAPTEFDAKKITDDLREHYGSSIKITEPKDVFARDGRQNEQFVNTAMQKQIDSLRQSGAFKRLDTHEQAAVIDRLTSSAAAQTMNRGLKQRYLPRGYVKGASTNIFGSMDEYSSYSSRYLAKLKHQAELMDNTEAVKDWLKDNEHLKDVLAEQRVYNAMMHRLHSPTENPRDNMVNRAVDRALKWTMLDKLPGVGYFIANATDAIAVGLPLMAGRHGMIRALGMMGGMYRLSRKLRAVGSGLHDLVEAIKAGTDMTDYEQQIMKAVAGEADGGRLGRLYQHAFERAMFDRSANLEYQNTYMLNKSVIDKVGDYGTGIFQGVNTAIEAVNRFVTLGTAYRLEFNRLSKKGMGEEAAHEAAVQYAMNIGHEANGVYANFNTPEFFNKGPLAKLIFQFKKYPQRIMMNYIRAGQGAIGLLKGERTEENIERAKQLGYMLATQGILAGTLGMPTEMFSMPLNALYMAGISKYNWDDAQNGYRQWAAEHFGKEGGAILAHGLLRYMTGTAIDQRLGQDSLLTFGSPGSPKSNDLKAAVANFMLGATGGSAFQKLTGIQQLSAAGHAYLDGADDVALKHLGEASRNLSPFRFATDIITAANRSTLQGTETYAGRPMMKPYSAGEQVLRSVGIQPAREAEAGDERRSLQRERQVILNQKKSYTDEFVGSPTGAQKERVWAKVQAWNAAHPGVPPLTRSDLLKAQGTRAKAEKAPTSMLGLPGDKTMQALQRRGSVYLTGE